MEIDGRCVRVKAVGSQNWKEETNTIVEDQMSQLSEEIKFLNLFAKIINSVSSVQF